MTHYAAGTVMKAAWEKEIARRTHDTFADMTKQSAGPVEAPGPGAGLEERLQYVHHQLDSLAGREILQGLQLLEGSSNLLQGGAVPMSFLNAFLKFCCRLKHQQGFSTQASHELTCRIRCTSQRFCDP
jgi:hypothetical protein